jgi:HAE1 family hydrophobic/amphiphilic exporter-1
MLKRFIERPVLSTVVSIILLILGGLSIFTLPISLFPDIAPPSVQVQATYPGANSEVVARSVATPLEEAINGVEGMTYMTSNSSNDGSMLLTVFFKQGTNPDIAAVNVQNRVSKATSQIPAEVIQAGISTQKVQNSIIMFIGLYSTDSSYDETFLQNYAKINLIPKIQRIPGVADAQPFGTKDYSMRIWLKPDRLVANNLSPVEVTNAIRDQSIEAAPGRLGQSSKEVYEYVLKYKGKLSKNEDYENIIVKSNSDGSVVRLGDVARVEFGSYTYSSNSTLNGHPTTGIAVQQLSGSNANDILTNAEKLLDKFSEQLPKGLHTSIMFNSKEFLDASIDQVKHTLVEAFILVFIVVFIFLQDFRSTLIPAIAVPVAIVGTFFFLQVFGFTINLLTLFALVLAIGIVVDDAIVVVEAVHAKMENSGLPVKEATLKAMSEISGAIMSITLVMAAVFIPVGFMKGPTGVFYRQFGYTLAIAIFISAVNALTLSPALCAIFLKDLHAVDEHGKRKGFGARFFAGFNTGFKTMTARYAGSLRFLFRHKWITIVALVLLAGSAYSMMQRTPSGFIPTEDQGFILYAVNTPPGSSLDKTHKAIAEIDSIIKASPVTDRRYNVEGLNFITNANASPYGAGFVRMKPVDERGPVKDINTLSGMLTMQVASQVKDAHAFFFTFPTIQGFGNVAGFEFALQDQTNGSMDRLGAMSNQFIGALMQRKEIAYALTTFSSGNPQYMMDVDNNKAKQMGVSVSDLMQTMQIYFGSSFVSDFNRFGKYYRVMAQADIPYRNNEASLTGIYVKNNLGQMVPVNQLITLRKVYGPETVSHNNLYNSATINGVPKPGYSTGDAIKAVEETAAKVLPKGWGYEFTGITREEKLAGSQIVFIFILSLVFIYFLLAAQYESYILPFAIVLSIPAGVFGVFAFLQIFGIDNNIYVQVSLIMLVGLLAKNAILITEYAVQRRHAGMELWAAATEAAKLRLRPILMTSFAFIVGLMPLMRAKGAAALGNRSIGTGAVGGMLTGVILGVFIVPVLFIIFQYLQEKFFGKKYVKTPALAE